MSIHLETITPVMHEIASEIFTLGEEWYLAGGTALALHIGHRESVDLDYFIATPFDTAGLKERLHRLWQDREWQVSYEAPNTLRCSVDGVKVSFITRSVLLQQPVMVINNFRLAGIQDIVVMKLLAICSREEYKDYFDLACLATMTDVRQWINWWGEAYPTQDVISWLIALGHVTNITEIPLQVSAGYKEVRVVNVLTKALQEIQSFLRTVS